MKTSTKYGHPIEKWEAAKREMKSILYERAKKGKTIAYSELAGLVKSIYIEPDEFAMAVILGEISSEEDVAGRGMLTVLVVHKGGDMQPGPGFFELAQQLGRDNSNELECWIAEFKRVCNIWQKQRKVNRYG